MQLLYVYFCPKSSPANLDNTENLEKYKNSNNSYREKWQKLSKREM